jgi:non-specific serine/threonine protein kinase/serine/threonine-protein kinase
MTPEHWHRVKEIFHAAMERNAVEWEAFVGQRSGGDAALRDEVLSLLRSHDSAGSFIEQPATVRFEAPATEPEAAPSAVGPYRLERRLAVGGMGAVYLGIRCDDVYRKRVAVKLLRSDRWLLDPLRREDSLRRFRFERQTLADLDHPHIARLLDGGTTDDGAPYLVMDFIEGEPIDEYCDARGLSIADRVRLFGKVCEAVHFAHRHLVVHRDLKPGNILVTPEGMPKLLDFGIAKLLDEERAADSATTMLQPMTPEYASPEQVRGQRITTATDVYSLGVILYELLTGHRPYAVDQTQPHELSKAICETEPEKPSTVVLRSSKRATRDGTSIVEVTPASVSAVRGTAPERLRRTLAGDLDMILLKTLRKEPQRRYASVEQLAADLGRYLEGHPVLARPDAILYRARKFVRRHAAGVAAATLLLAAVVAGAAATAWQARVARHRFEQVRRLANTFVLDFHDQIRDLPGATAARSFLVRTALEYLDSLASEASDDPALQRELAQAYEKVGDVQGNPFEPTHLGNTVGAQASYRKCLAIRQPLARAAPGDAAIQRELAIVLAKLGNVQMAGQPDEAFAAYRQSQAILESLLASEPSDLPLEHALSNTLLGVAELLTMQRRFEEAVEAFDRGLAIRERLAIGGPSDPGLQANLAVALTKSARALVNQRRVDEAMPRYERALEITRALALHSPESLSATRDLILGLEGMANALTDLGRDDQAISYYQQAVELAESLRRIDPDNAQACRDLSTLHNSLGDLLREGKRAEEALVHHRESLALHESLAGANPGSVQARRDLATAFYRVSHALEALGRTEDALEACARSLAIRRQLAEGGAAGAPALREQAHAECRAGMLHHRLARSEEAASHTAACLSLWRRLCERPDARASDWNALGWMLLTCEPPALREYSSALSAAQRAVEMSGATDPAYLDTLALAYFETGDLALAMETGDRAVARLGSAPASLRRKIEENREKLKQAIAARTSP